MASSPAAANAALTELVERLYPICRSITGDGVRETLAIVGERLPLDVHEVPSGEPALDWQVPDEWNIRDAYIARLTGERVIDFATHNLHVLNYSEPVDAVVTREELDRHLHSLPEQPDRIPYRTSYYTRQWGFCVTQNQRDALTDERYRVVVDADLGPGSLTYGETRIAGSEAGEVLLYTHVCHPSLCNDNLSGIAVLSEVGRRLAGDKRRYSYRLVFGPGTIGSIVWLSRNRDVVEQIRHGLVVGLLGDDAAFTYKRSRHGEHEIDRVADYVLAAQPGAHRVLPFSPYGYDERQFGSPGFDMPVGRLTRSVNGGYPQYHSSGDDLSIVTEERLQQAVDTVMQIMDTLEANRHYMNLQPYGEPQLGRRGLYRSTGGTDVADREEAMLWLLNQCDGRHSLLDVATRSGIAFGTLVDVAGELEAAQLLAPVERDTMTE